MHTQYTALMSLTLDGEASEAQAARLRQHLAVCPICAQTWANWDVADRRFRQAPPLPLNIDLTARVLAGLDARELARRRSRWLGSGVVAGWVGLMFAWLGLTAAAAGWLRLHPGAADGLLAVAQQMLDMAGWVGAALLTPFSNLGAPRLALGFGFLTSLTCLLGMMWLWLMGRPSRWSPARAYA